MKYVLTLIGKDLTGEAVQRVADAAGIKARADWLGEAEAADLCFDGPGPGTVAERLAKGLQGTGIDFAVQKISGRRRKLLLADMDSTIINVECMDEMADMVGLRDAIGAVTRQAMAGEIDFARALRQRVALLKGLTGMILQFRHLR